MSDAQMLSEVADLVIGQSPPSESYNEDGNGLPFYQGKTDFGSTYPTPRKYCTEPKKIAEPGDILMSVRAPVGATNLCKAQSCIGRGIAAIRVKHINRDFLYFYLRKIETYIDNLGSGAIFKAINKSQLCELPINEVGIELPEQKKIAHILSTVQKAIEAQERIIQTTTELKKTLMQKLFTEGLKGEARKQTEIGLVPESWEVVPLSSTIRSNLQNGAFVKKPETGVGYLFANVVDMYRETHLDLTQLERLNVEPYEIERYWLEDGDVLVVRSSLKREGIGQNCVVRDLYEPVFYDCHLIRVQTKQDELLSEFLSHYWRSDIGKGDLVLRSKTTTMTTINQQGISKALVPVPPIEEQEQIVKHLGLLDQKAMKHRTVK